MKKKTTHRVLASMLLMAGMGLWASTTGTPAVAAEGPLTTPEAEPESCWQCVKDSDCDARCDGPGSGYCRWSGCTTCLCLR
ncbi:hypothetical protein [Chondromyces crocatus]|uniref:Uncharacterized protein n=1 Tax=Chondromyces crocatus TaxID=52 RepID=A0A0K1ESV8_CHOCO|nr:hypothetical protein [Chondromyces crocatus]AKT43884.1 uncharacterized protein CMC5_081210 [Chondromyces crocatus]